MHRPRYDDWTLPKGKLNEDEAHPTAALREVEEETGLRATLGTELAPSAYTDGRGRPKVVRWWSMTPDGGTFVPGPEVDDARWLPVADAALALSYDRDRDVLRSFTSQPGTAAVLLVRHGDAGDRRRWSGEDRLRPLSPRGRRQARALVDQLAGYGAVRVVSSSYLRCVETVEPLARARQLRVETSPALAEGAGRDDVRALLDRVRGTAAVLCTHGDVAGEVLEAVGRGGAPCAKGSTWAIDYDGRQVVAARYLEPPA